MIPSDPDQALDSMLRRSAELQSIPDDGFSSRVLAALPSPRPAQITAQTKRRAIVCLIGAGVGAILATSQGSRLPPLASLGEFWIKLADDSLQATSQVVTTIDVNLPVLAQIAAALVVAALLLMQRPSRSLHL